MAFHKQFRPDYSRHEGGQVEYDPECIFACAGFAAGTRRAGAAGKKNKSDGSKPPVCTTHQHSPIQAGRSDVNGRTLQVGRRKCQQTVQEGEKSNPSTGLRLHRLEQGPEFPVLGSVFQRLGQRFRGLRTAAEFDQDPPPESEGERRFGTLLGGGGKIA